MAPVDNVLLVVIDALRTDRVGVYNDTDLTPNIDELASDGRVFENCFSCINATDPSLTTILTGQYPVRHGVLNHGDRVTESERRRIAATRNVAERISESHTTIAADILGRWHKRGFDHYYQESPEDSMDNSVSQQSREYLSKAITRLPDPVQNTIENMYRRLLINKDLSQIKGESISKAVINGIDEADGPWFALAHYWDTHIPYRPGDLPPENRGRSYQDYDTPINEIIKPIENSDWGEKLRDGLLGDAETLGDIYRRYDAAVNRVDREVERLIDHLRNSNELENTVVVITSDHGESLTEHSIFFDHHGLYDPSIHVPLIIRSPGFEARESQFVQHFDIVPTILEQLGKEYESTWFDGVSLVPDGSGVKRLADRSAIYAEEAHTARRRCVRTDSFKYIRRIDDESGCRYCDIQHGPEEELFDLNADAAETENIVDDRPEVATRLGELLDHWIGELPESDEGEVNFEEDSEVMQRLDDMGYV